MQSWYLGAGARLSIAGQGSVNGELWDRFVRGCDAHHAATGLRTQVNSVMRSSADQRRFWDAHVAHLQGGPWAPLAARPGTSNHERGLAIDAQPAGGVALHGSPWQQAMRAHGLHFPVSGEAWHVELAPSRRPLPQPPQPPAPPEEDIMASIQDLERVLDAKLTALGLGTVAAVMTHARPMGSYRTPNGSIYIVLADGTRVAPSPAQLTEARYIGVVPAEPVQVGEAGAKHLASLFPLR